MRTLIVATVVALGFAWGCAGTGSSGTNRASSDRNRITRDQLEGIPSLTAREAIRRYNGEWLRGRAGSVSGSGTRNYAAVFLDGRPYGDLEILDQFANRNIEELVYIRASDATTRYGTGYPAGIINIVSRME